MKKLLLAVLLAATIVMPVFADCARDRADRERIEIAARIERDRLEQERLAALQRERRVLVAPIIPVVPVVVPVVLVRHDCDHHDHGHDRGR